MPSLWLRFWRRREVGDLHQQGFGFRTEVEEEVDGTKVGDESETGVEDLGIGRKLRIEN